jgi:hypothetical protein
MDQLENARLAWQAAQAELQIALADLEKCVAQLAAADAVSRARDVVAARQSTADLLLQRYITQLGKS